MFTAFSSSLLYPNVSNLPFRMNNSLGISSAYFLFSSSKSAFSFNCWCSFNNFLYSGSSFQFGTFFSSSLANCFWKSNLDVFSRNGLLLVLSLFCLLLSVLFCVSSVLLSVISAFYNFWTDWFCSLVLLVCALDNCSLLLFSCTVDNGFCGSDIISLICVEFSPRELYVWSAVLE